MEKINIVLLMIIVVLIIMVKLRYTTASQGFIDQKQKQFDDASRELDEYLEHALDRDHNLLGNSFTMYNFEDEDPIIQAQRTEKGKRLIVQHDHAYVEFLLARKKIDNETLFLEVYERNRDESIVEKILIIAEASGLLR